jgi:hypothetical protein
MTSLALIAFSAKCETGCNASKVIAVAKILGSDSPYLAGRALTVCGWVCTGPKGSTTWCCPACWAKRLTARGPNEADVAAENLRSAWVIQVETKARAA